ncbi:MAG: hypothetical protein HGB12_01220 [Bacteroidetes bacterium]|nr:hypothetical protein [Bacteroidota bacterium]
MKDKLEKYVSENRILFDDEEPGNELWDKIAGNIYKPKVRKINLQGFIWKAAAVIVIFIASYFFHDFIQQDIKKPANIVYKHKETIFIKRKVNDNHKQKMEQIVSIASVDTKKTYNTVYVKNDVNTDNYELTEVRAYYTKQINEKENEIYKYAAFDPNIKTRIKIEFNQLDSIYSSLRRDLKDNIDNKEVVEAMIQNYRIRMEILENILQQLQGKESNETKKPRYEI